MFQIKRKIFHLIFVLIWLLGFSACSVREHQNIFDPQNKLDSLNLNLILTRADSLVSFYWSPPGNIEYTGFHIYRKKQGQEAFQSLPILPPQQSTFTDSSVSFNLLYAYYLKLVGRSTESPPTRVLRTIPGPGKIWILDRWDEYFYKYSYDLRHKYLTHYAIWIPQDLALNKKAGQLMVTYPLFHYVELIDSQSGVLINAIQDLRYPFACVYHARQNTFWLTDSTGYLYRFKANNLQDKELIDDALNKPVTLVTDAFGNVYLLDTGLNQIIVYEASGARINKISDYGKLTFLTVDATGHYVHFISKQADSSRIYLYSPLTHKTRLLYSALNIDVVRQSPLDQTLWLVQNNASDARILQLSDQGVRLKSLSGYKKIEDLAVNPYNGNIVIADRKLHQVCHLTFSGQLIGTIDDAPFPFRILIE